MADNPKYRIPARTLVGLAALFIVALWVLTPGESSFKKAVNWQRMVEPGELSVAHHHLEKNCAACHVSVKGVEPFKCIACHADNESLLQRQPTSFHAGISSCIECHPEHQGPGAQPTLMSHSALAEIGLRQLNDQAPDSGYSGLRTNLIDWGLERIPPNPHISALEATLACTTCHQNDDRHFKLFGQDCAQCHAVDRWTVPEFSHPSVRSMDCAQCHQAPPSHYMMKHFGMISAQVAGKPKARVDQCFQCHQTNSWNDIKNAGWYKHH